jgi:hypothetical protein
MAVRAVSTASQPQVISESDAALLDWVQRQTLDYFWSFAHPASGMARERSNPAPDYDYRETVTSGGTGFGIMALIAGASRGFLPLAGVRDHVRKIVAFLGRAESFHGVFPHFIHGTTGAAIPFSQKDDGGDLVETAFLVVGLLCARQFFSSSEPADCDLRNAIDELWHAVEWDWHTRGDETLYWHWSPRHGWDMDHAITGWNECLITHVLAAASATHAVAPSVYHHGWASGPAFRNGESYYGIELPLGPAFGGPLFFSQYSFLGLDPRGLRDRYADYWRQNCAHTQINRAYCLANPNEFAGYGESCWGLTACDGNTGYGVFSPTHDRGVIAPTAALSAMPYTPRESMAVLKNLYTNRKAQGRFGFVDAFNASSNWYADSNLAIDQGPIVIMVENYRSGLLWNLFMSCDEVGPALARLGFERSANDKRPGR